MKYFFLTLSVLFLLASCSQTSTQTKDISGMLRTGKWKISSMNVKLRKPNGLDTTIDMLHQPQSNRYIPECKRGVYIVFGQGFNGSMYSGTPCNPGDPAQIDFQWKLTNNNTILNLYDGFNLVYTMTDTILPYHFDTTWYPAGSNPPYSFDSIVNMEDTSVGGNPPYPVLDTIWNLQFDTIPDPYINIYGQITNFSQSSFTLTFAEITVYPDSTHNKANLPVYKPDTAHFTVIFNNF